MIALLGSVLGFATSFAPKIFQFLENKQDHKQELERMKLSAELQKEIAGQKLQADMMLAKIATNQDVIKHDASLQNTAVWVQNIRALMRPMLTIGILGVYAYCLIQNDSVFLASTAFIGIEAMTATAWSFWFGERLQKK